MKHSHALIIMAKAPDKDTVMTRLRGHLPDNERLNLYTSMLDGTVENLRDVPGADTYISFWPPDSVPYFERFGLPSFPQSEGDIGMKMHHSLRIAFANGYEKAAVVGVDIPDLLAQTIEKAFALLDGTDIVFGPTRDGGYYLVGMKRPHKEIFEGITWSTDKTLDETLKKTEELGLKTAFTETLYDIDTPDDLKRLKRDNAS